jgi:hypothetical protein
VTRRADCKEYEDALVDTGIPQDEKTLISDLLASQRMHVQTSQRPDVEGLNLVAVLDHIRCHIGGTAVNQES